MNLRKTKLFKEIDNYSDNHGVNVTVGNFCAENGIEREELIEALEEFFSLSVMERGDFLIINPKSEAYKND